MGKADRYSAFVWFVFSLLASYQSYRLGMGSLHQPGPGFVFFWTAIIVAMLSLAVVIKSFVEKTGEERKEERVFAMKGVRKVTLVVTALLLYALLIERVGFVILTFLLLIFLLKAIEKKPWLLTLLVGVTVTAVSYLLFEVALQSQLPKGLLGRLGF